MYAADESSAGRSRLAALVSPYRPSPDEIAGEALRGFFDLTVDEIVDRLPTRTIQLLVDKKPTTLSAKRFFVLAQEECFQRWPLLKTEWPAVESLCNLHHKRFRCMGGSNEIDNWILMDVDVHSEIHSRTDKIFAQMDRIVQLYQPETNGIATTLVNFMKGLA